MLISSSLVRRYRTAKQSSRLFQEGEFETHEILHSQLTGLVNLFQVFEYVVSVRIDHGDSEVSVVLVLAIQSSIPVGTGVGTRHTEYEFSPSCDDPVARMFGE